MHDRNIVPRVQNGRTYYDVGMSRAAFVSLALVAALLPFSHVSAHVTGVSLIATSTPYVIDVGYDDTIFYAGRAVLFDFLLTDSAYIPADYDHVWVRIVKEKQTFIWMTRIKRFLTLIIY